jgi:hypothetical protein
MKRKITGFRTRTLSTQAQLNMYNRTPPYKLSNATRSKARRFTCTPTRKRGLSISAGMKPINTTANWSSSSRWPKKRMRTLPFNRDRLFRATRFRQVILSRAMTKTTVTWPPQRIELISQRRERVPSRVGGVVLQEVSDLQRSARMSRSRMASSQLFGNCSRL